MAASSQDPPSVAVRPLPRQTPEVGAVCGKPARTDLSGGRSAMDVPTAIEPMAIAACGRLHGDARMRRWCATAFVTSMVVLLPRPPYGERTTASAEANPQEAHRTLHRPRDEDVPPTKTAGRRDDRKARGFPNQERPEKDRPGKLQDRRREQADNLSAGPMASVREWQFKRKFRTNAYGWRAPRLAIGRLQEAAPAIRSVAKSDPVAAGEGVVSLMERIWPSFQGIDTSSGALGAAVLRTVNELIPILTVAPADHATRGKWLERLFKAVQNDGVEYLAPLEDRWGEIAQYPDLIDEYADRMIGMVRRARADHQTFQHVVGTSICLRGPLRRTSRTPGHTTDEVLVLAQIRRRGFGSSGIVGRRDRVCRS